MKCKSYKSYRTQKKGEEKGKKKVRIGKWQKKSKFWLMRIHQIKIFYIFVPNLKEIYQFGHKIAFSVNLRLIYGHSS